MTPLDIIVGGAGDRIFGCARNYAQDLSDRHPERDVVYLPQGKRRNIIDLATSGRSVNLIGHSWGAADIGWVIQGHHPALKVRTAIAVDPVGKPLMFRSMSSISADRLIRIDGTESEGRLMDGNLTARLGRMIGRECPAAFSGNRTICIKAPFAHYNMMQMMRYAGPDGRCAEDWFLSDSLIET